MQKKNKNSKNLNVYEMLTVQHRTISAVQSRSSTQSSVQFRFSISITKIQIMLVMTSNVKSCKSVGPTLRPSYPEYFILIGQTVSSENHLSTFYFVFIVFPRKMGKLNVTVLRYLTRDDFRVLTAVSILESLEKSH